MWVELEEKALDVAWGMAVQGCIRQIFGGPPGTRMHQCKRILKEKRQRKGNMYPIDHISVILQTVTPQSVTPVALHTHAHMRAPQFHLYLLAIRIR